MTRVVHVIQQLSLGGAARSHLAVAKYSAKAGEIRHALASLLEPQPEAVELARASGVEVLPFRRGAELDAELEHADIVHLGWWNAPEVDDWLRSQLPPMRLCIWFHVAGDHPPQIITRELVELADLALAACPHSLRVEALRRLSDEERQRRCALVYDAADFARLGGLEPRPHSGFVVGYAGTLSFQKLHPDYLRMCASIRVPDVRFAVCGGGAELLASQAERLGVAERFDFRGYVADIGTALAEFDVFGYPLCENTYAAGELVLQEAMYAGIPPVVFPHGGIRDLVIPDFTGLVATSELEYRDAVEHLYHEPQERARLGRNAREYARQLFGAENAARALNRVYARMLGWPKRSRSLPSPCAGVATTVRDDGAPSGAARFIASLGPFGADFEASLAAREDALRFPEDERIAGADDLLWEGAGGIRSYARRHPDDPWLRLWSGLVLRERGRFDEALVELRAARELHLSHWRALWYLAQCAHEAGHWQLAERALWELGERPEGPQPPGSLARLAAAVEQRRASLERFRDELRRDAETAAETLEGLLREFPQSPDLLNARAEYELERGERAKGVELLQGLAAAHPDHAGILNNLAVLRWQEGDSSGALSLLREAVRLDPRDPAARANLAQLSGASG